MTDAEAEDWFKKNATYRMSHQVGLTIYQLAKTGGQGAETVEVAIPENAPHPEPIEVQRFLVKWWLKAYEG